MGIFYRDPIIGVILQILEKEVETTIQYWG